MRSSLYIWIALAPIIPSFARPINAPPAFATGMKQNRSPPQIHPVRVRVSSSPPPPLQIHNHLLPNRSSHLASTTDSNNNPSPPPPQPQEVPLLTHARQSIPPNFTLRQIPGKGTGVITTIPILQNTAVGDYIGEILTHEEKDRRYLPSRAVDQTMEDKAWIQSRIDREQTLTGTYVYGVTVPDDDPPLYVDSEDEDVGGWTRFLNHSGDLGGCNLVPKSVHESWDGKPRVWFVAKRDIEAGEELCFDYGDGYWLEGDVVA